MQSNFILFQCRMHRPQDTGKIPTLLQSTNSCSIKRSHILSAAEEFIYSLRDERTKRCVNQNI